MPCNVHQWGARLRRAPHFYVCTLEKYKAFFGVATALSLVATTARPLVSSFLIKYFGGSSFGGAMVEECTDDRIPQEQAAEILDSVIRFRKKKRPV